ncbi:MAG: VOC family protein [Cohaesibacteraceae bacterium]|nr:VOC family protein [Cohaesibacteraceae bacterium]MBL4875419.1 VOC family protein [Cohaesibacteraceae bacterium]
MKKVEGIGGVFFRAKNPAGLSQWYENHPGVNIAPTDEVMTPWNSKEGVTVFAPFKQDTDYFPAQNQFMVNFRVRDLDAMLTQLRAADIAITHEESMEGVGRFARIHDPEGNLIELWQPSEE